MGSDFRVRLQIPSSGLWRAQVRWTDISIMIRQGCYAAGFFIPVGDSRVRTESGPNSCFYIPMISVYIQHVACMQIRNYLHPHIFIDLYIYIPWQHGRHAAGKKIQQSTSRPRNMLPKEPTQRSHGQPKRACPTQANRSIKVPIGRGSLSLPMLIVPRRAIVKPPYTKPSSP